MTKTQFETAVRTGFAPLLTDGYRYDIDTPEEYFQNRSDIEDLVPLPKTQWNRIWYVSLEHQTNPRPRNNRSIEFDIITRRGSRKFHFYHLWVDPERRSRGEGVQLIKSMAGTAGLLGFDTIEMANGSFSSIPHEMYRGQLNEKGDIPNTLDWLRQRFPQLGQLRYVEFGTSTIRLSVAALI